MSFGHTLGLAGSESLSEVSPVLAPWILGLNRIFRLDGPKHELGRLLIINPIFIIGVLVIFETLVILALELLLNTHLSLVILLVPGVLVILLLRYLQNGIDRLLVDLYYLLA